jgi:hypothetical protein
MRQGRKFGTRYPWERWFAFSEFTLYRGVDFQGRADTMAQLVRQAAKRPNYNVRVNISISEDQSCLTVLVHRMALGA